MRTSQVFRHPVSVATSQNGMTSERIGKIRPDVALRAWTSSSVTRLRVRMGMPMPPQATGCRVGDQAEQGRLEWREPQPHQKGRGDRHGSPETGRTLDQGPEAEGHQHHLEPPVRRKPGDRGLHDLELSGLHRDIVEEHRRHDQPDDPEQREGHPHRHARQDHRHRHAERRASATSEAVTKPASAAFQALARPEASSPSKTRTGSAETIVEIIQFPIGS